MRKYVLKLVTPFELDGLLNLSGGAELVLIGSQLLFPVVDASVHNLMSLRFLFIMGHLPVEAVDVLGGLTDYEDRAFEMATFLTWQFSIVRLQQASAVFFVWLGWDVEWARAG